MWVLHVIWERGWRSAHTTVAWVRFTDLMSHVGCSEGFSPGPLVSSLHKNQHFEFQFNLETVDEKSQLVECPLLNDLIPLIIMVIVVIFVCPILLICYVLSMSSSWYPSSSRIFTQILLFCTFATFRIALLIIKMVWEGILCSVTVHPRGTLLSLLLLLLLLLYQQCYTS